MYDSGRAAADIVAAEGLAQISDTSSLEPIVTRVVGAHPDIVAEIRAGKDRKFQFLVGQVMKETKGKGDPEARHRADAGRHQFLSHRRHRKRTRMLIRAAGIYLVAALVLTWPLAIHLTSRLGAVEGAGDPYLNLWILGWGMKAWLSAPMSVLDGSVFNANIFHPVRRHADVFGSPAAAVAGDVAALRRHRQPRALLQRAADRVVGAERAGDARAGAQRDRIGTRRRDRRPGVGVLAVSHRAFAPPAIAVACISCRWRCWCCTVWPPRAAGAMRCGSACLAALQAISSVYYGVMSAIAIAVGAMSLAWTTGQWRSRAVLVTPRGGGGDRRRADRSGGLAVLGDAAARRVWAQPVRGGAELGDGAELHAGAARELPVRRATA